MKVTLETYGGLAGVRRPARTVDGDALSPADAAELARRVAEARAAPAPPPGPGRVRDGMGYTIIVDDGGPPLEQSDGAMSAEFATLLKLIERHVGA